MKPVFLLLSHRHDDKILKAYRRLAEATTDFGPLFMLYHAPDGHLPVIPQDISVTPFSDLDLSNIGFNFFRKNLIPGSAHFPLLEFARHNPQYSHYWIIEYDVYFSGNWKSLFTHFANNDADLLASHIRYYHDEPDWAWWKLTHPFDEIPLENRLRAFCPIYRMSGRAIAHIDNLHKQGVTGHYEMLYPSYLYRDGFRIQDFGGAGKFVAEGDKNRFYRDDESGDPEGRLRHGTMRFRPRFRLPGLHRNKLYHPVK